MKGGSPGGGGGADAAAGRWWEGWPPALALSPSPPLCRCCFGTPPLCVFGAEPCVTPEKTSGTATALLEPTANARNTKIGTLRPVWGSGAGGVACTNGGPAGPSATGRGPRCRALKGQGTTWKRLVTRSRRVGEASVGASPFGAPVAGSGPSGGGCCGRPPSCSNDCTPASAASAGDRPAPAAPGPGPGPGDAGDAGAAALGPDGCSDGGRAKVGVWRWKRGAGAAAFGFGAAAAGGGRARASGSGAGFAGGVVPRDRFLSPRPGSGSSALWNGGGGALRWGMMVLEASGAIVMVVRASGGPTMRRAMSVRRSSAVKTEKSCARTKVAVRLETRPSVWGDFRKLVARKGSRKMCRKLSVRMGLTCAPKGRETTVAGIRSGRPHGAVGRFGRIGKHRSKRKHESKAVKQVIKLGKCFKKKGRKENWKRQKR